MNANQSASLSAASYGNHYLPLNTMAFNNLQTPEQSCDIRDYFDGPISYKDNWTILSPHHAMPPYAAHYSVQFQAHEEDWRKNIPLGMKFRPTDQELIVNYLQLQYIFGEVQGGIIPLVDIYHYCPDRLQALTRDHGDGKMYFFTKIKKIGKSKTDRSVKSKIGCYWKATQALKPIKHKNGSTIGYKMPLTYIKRSVKTAWLMAEYRLYNPFDSKNSPQELVLAVIYRHEKKL